MPLCRKALLHLLPCLCAALLTPASHAQSTGQQLPEKALASLQQQVAFDDNLANARNPVRLHIQFSKIGESIDEKGHSAMYRAFVAGAPEDKKYALAIWKIGSSPQVLPGDVYVNAKGLLMVKKPRPDQEYRDLVDSDDEVDLTIQAARGEPVRYLLATEDGSFSVPGTIVPFPIENTNRNCRLEARYALPDAMAVLIYADGLTPNSDVPYEASSGEKLPPGKFQVDGRGHAVTVILPSVAGKTTGVLKVSLATKECLASVEMPWGAGSYHLF